MEKLKKDLELVSVDYENNGAKAVMTFLDREEKAVRVVNFNKQVYDRDRKAFIPDEKKAEQVEQWSQEYFGTSFDNIQDKIGTKHDVYVYDKFCSLWKSEQVMKFTPEMEGQIYQTTVKSVTVDDLAIHIRYEIDGDTFESKMGYGQYMESMKEWFVDPLKKDRQFEKFEDKFGVPVEDGDKIVGHPLMVEVKKAMGKYLYGDLKKFPRK